jgi:actin-related protein
MVEESLKKVEMVDVVKLLQNVIVTGGTTMFAGFATRLTKELSDELT